MMPEFKRIIIHHSAGTDRESLQWDNILEYHTKGREWRDIAYHFLVENVEGAVICIAGRPLNTTGAHATGHNHDSIGICFVGNYENDEFTREMMEEAIYRIIVPCCDIFGIDPENIIGHRDTKPTICPGENIYSQLPHMRAQVTLELQK